MTVSEQVYFDFTQQDLNSADRAVKNYSIYSNSIINVFISYLSY